MSGQRLPRIGGWEREGRGTGRGTKGEGGRYEMGGNEGAVDWGAVHGRKDVL